MGKSGDSKIAQKYHISKILRGSSPEIRALLSVAHEQGFRVDLAKNNHYRVRTPEHWQNQEVAFTPKTPSEYRAVGNTKRKLRHMGVEFPRR